MGTCMKELTRDEIVTAIKVLECQKQDILNDLVEERGCEDEYDLSIEDYQDEDIVQLSEEISFLGACLSITHRAAV